MKQAILVRTDLDMGKGKMIAQSAHASLEAALELKERKPSEFRLWMDGGAKKVVLKIKSLQELISYVKKAKSKKLVTALIRDAGHTQLRRGTVTAGAIGPGKDPIVDSITGDLKLL